MEMQTNIALVLPFVCMQAAELLAYLAVIHMQLPRSEQGGYYIQYVNMPLVIYEYLNTGLL